MARDPSHSDHPLTQLIGRPVVLDTAGTMLYIGTLRDIHPDGYWLEDADVHDCRDGHASKELYLCESREHGVRVGRARVFVFREAVISASSLDDVIVC